MRLNKKHDLSYLYGKKRTIYWKIIAGPSGAKLSSLQDHDLILDDYDLKIRKMNSNGNFQNSGE